MTDKQIIDGVDVAECEDYGYRGKAGYWCHNYDEPCTDYPNCNYKQRKRKEQECEELKKHVFGLRPELKSMIDKTCCKYNIEAKYYHDKIVEIINNLDKYEQTLTEIKEIAENVQSFVGRINIEDDVFEQMEQILQKISEVENEN